MPKVTCERLPKVRTRYFRLRRGRSIEQYRHLTSFALTMTPCYFGGERYWFVCQGRSDNSCGRRVGVLYLIDGNFACRLCHDLAYESQQKNHVGKRAFCQKFVAQEKAMEKAFMEMRRKSWRGKPTKRFKRWLESSERHSLKLPRYLVSEMRLLGLFSKRIRFR